MEWLREQKFGKVRGNEAEDADEDEDEEIFAIAVH